MSLSDSRVEAVIAVADVARAKEFYEGKLGLGNGEQRGDGGTTYTVAGGTRIHVYPSPDNAGSSSATVAAFEVDEIERMVDELSANGVAFEQYDTDAIKTDEKGIVEMGGERAAWLKDPDGNLLAIAQGA